MPHLDNGLGAPARLQSQDNDNNLSCTTLRLTRTRHSKWTPLLMPTWTSLVATLLVARNCLIDTHLIVRIKLCNLWCSFPALDTQILVGRHLKRDSAWINSFYLCWIEVAYGCAGFLSLLHSPLVLKLVSRCFRQANCRGSQSLKVSGGHRLASQFHWPVKATTLPCSTLGDCRTIAKRSAAFAWTSQYWKMQASMKPRKFLALYIPQSG